MNFVIIKFTGDFFVEAPAGLERLQGLEGLDAEWIGAKSWDGPAVFSGVSLQRLI